MADSWISNLADTFRNTSTSALGAGFRALRDPGGFLRDDLPPEADDLTKWIQDRNRRACRLHARNEAAGVYSNLGKLRRPRYGHCKPYLDSINEGPTAGGSYAPPFTGGQCPEKYGWVVGVAAQPINPQTTPPFSDTATVNCAFGGIRGPLSLASRSVGGQLQIGFTVPVQAGAPDGFANLLSVSAATYQAPYTTSISITPCAGNPDNCGNPPNNYTPPSFPPNLPPLPPTTIAPPGGDGDDDIQVDPDGNWRICENGVCTPWFPPGGGGGPDSGGGPGEPDGDPNETDPDDPDNPNEVSGCVEDGNILTGLKIEVLEAPPNYQGLGDIYYRSCWIWMGPSSDLLDMVEDGRAIEDGQFVIPDSSDCTCYKVRANPGFRVSVQAYSRPKEE